MTPRPVDEYLARLERELHRRGLKDGRIVEEAREHLIDAVEEGRQRGLSVEDAERDAVERFGSAQTVATYVVPETERIMNRLAAVLAPVWHRRWWLLVPTVVTAVVTSAVSYYFLPTRYRSESIIRIVSPETVAGYVPSTDSARRGVQFHQISQSILSRTRLERMIRDFDLYRAERERALLSDTVVQMRRDINIDVLTSDHAQEKGVSGFNVSFVSSDPDMAMKITERLATLIIEESLREKEVQAIATNQFIESQIADMRRRLIAYENTLADLRAHVGRQPLSQADLLPYEVLRERYKALLLKSEESKAAANLERRQIGERFVVVDAPRRAERPLGPSRLGVNILGTFAGLGLGLVLVGVSRTSKDM
jgi:uncharacterized protein involved in exopolysaccharide biosynthesis